MDKRSTQIIVAVVVVAVALIGYIYYERAWNRAPAENDWVNAPAEPPAPAQERVIITAKHAYQNGKHIIAGEYGLPTPCHTLDTKYTLAENNTVVIDFLVSNPTQGACAQVVTPARFKIEIPAPGDAKFIARLNGQDVTLNLIEAGPGEDLSKFELYIKG